MQSVVLFSKSHRVLQNIRERLSRDTERRSDFSPSYIYIIISKNIFLTEAVVCVSPDEEEQHREWETNPSVSEVLQFGTSSHEVEAPHCPQLFLQVGQGEEEIIKAKQIKFQQRTQKYK